MEQPRIFLSPPFMGGEELNQVLSAFADNWIAPAGPQIVAFEQKISEYLPVDYTVALSSGTAAIHLALIILGIKENDEVICSSFTFCGSSNPIYYQKAIPIFIDSETKTWNMCPLALEEAIKDRIAKGKKPKAIILVHLYGMPAQLDAILAISKHYDIPIIEDAAEALGSSYRGQKLGSFGDIGILSFNGNKIITTSGGGMFLSNTKKYAEKAKFLSTQALDIAPYYLHSEVGFNYRMSNICAAIGVGQMKILDQIIEKTRLINFWYREYLPELEFLTESKNTYSNHWLTCILLPKGKNKEIKEVLEANNIESRFLWNPMHLQPLNATIPYYGKRVAQNLFERGLCLPSGAALSQKDIIRITKLIKAEL